MNFDEIKQLVEILDKSSLTELNIEKDGEKVVLKKEVQVVAAAPVQIQQHNIPVVNNVPTAPQTVEPVANSKLEGLDEITSPIVGTFYSAPSPSSPSFASVGSKVKKGQVLCIVEAMKLMNELTAEFDCEIVEILVKNEDVVQYGQPLFLVRPL